MAICTFFQQGRCKFGERCKFEHPRQSSAPSGPTNNRFGAFGGNQLDAGNNRSQTGAFSNVSREDIKIDLTAGVGRPDWVFSAYAPAKNAARQLFGGPQRERSMEEMRLFHYEAVAAGNPQAAIDQAQALWQESTQQMDAALRDLDGAVRYVLDGEKEHPNRLDIVERDSGPKGQDVFLEANAINPSTSHIKATSGIGMTPASWSQPAVQPFGQPAQPTPFGQPSQLGGSGFGQPSALGQGSGFGQPSALGQGSGFGQPSALGQGGGFGQPSALGQGGGFGKPSTLGQTAGFGKPSALGSNSSFANTQGTPNTFGQPGFSQAPNNPSPFSQAALQTKTPFGEVNTNTNNPSPFSQTASQSNPSPFGQPSQATNPFNQPQQPQQAASAPFGQPAPIASGFGSVKPSAAPFGQPAANQVVPIPQTNASQQAWVANSNSNELAPIPNLNGQTSRDPQTNRLVQWKGRPVQYLNEHPCYLHPQDNQTWVRINFPDGPPDPRSLRDSQGKPDEYTPEIEAMYKFFLENGHFKDEMIPPVPPKAEWISYGF